MEFETSESMESGAFLKLAGTYQLFVVDSEEQATDKDGRPCEASTVTCEAVAGTATGFEKKQIKLWINWPSANHKDGGAFARRVQTRWLVALGKLSPKSIGGRVSVDLTRETTMGCQFFATLKKKDNTEKLEVDGANVYHVDDPEASAFPRNEKMLAYLRPDQRLTAKDFGVESASPAAAPSASGNGAAPKPAAASKSSVNLDDI